MITTTNFPVIQGTELSLSCGQGYGLKGDGTVTCVTDTEFSVQEEPRCGKFVSINLFFGY